MPFYKFLPMLGSWKLLKSVSLLSHKQLFLLLRHERPLWFES